MARVEQSAQAQSRATAVAGGTAEDKGHVLLITGEYPPMSGGVGAYTQELGKALAARGWRVSVLTSHHAAGDATESHPAPPETAVRVEDAITIYPRVTKWGWQVRRQAAQLAEEIDADWLHVQYQTAAFGMHPAINFAPGVWRQHGRRVAWTYHDLLVPYLFPKAGVRLRRWVTERPTHTCDLTVVTNEGDRLALENTARNLVRIPIGSNIQALRFSPDERRTQRAQHGFGDDCLVVGYFGFLNRAKGGLVLIEAMSQLAARLPNVKLLMIGERVGASDPTNYPYLQQVEGAIHTYGLDEHVVWTGRQPEAVVSAELNACDVLLMPYLDGASLRRGTLMAGLAQGCAIVTTMPQAPLPELADGRDVLYVPPNDATAAAAAVIRLARDPDLVARLRRNAQTVSTGFTWEGIAEAHERLYLAT